jgi:hypothetical protein
MELSAELIPQSDEVEAYAVLLQLLEVDLVRVAQNTNDEERRIGYGMLQLFLDDIRADYTLCVELACKAGFDEEIDTIFTK